MKTTVLLDDIQNFQQVNEIYQKCKFQNIKLQAVIVGKPVLRVSNQVRHMPDSAATWALGSVIETGKVLLSNRGSYLKQRHLCFSHSQKAGFRSHVRKVFF